MSPFLLTQPQNPAAQTHSAVVQPGPLLSFSPALLTQGKCQPAPWKLLNLKYSFTPGNQLALCKRLQGAGSGIQWDSFPTKLQPYFFWLLCNTQDSAAFLTSGSKVCAFSCPQMISKIWCWDPLPIQAAHPLWSKHELIISDQEHHCCESQMLLNRNSSTGLSSACHYFISHYTFHQLGSEGTHVWLQFRCGTAVSSLPFRRMWGMRKAELPWKHLGSFPRHFSPLWAQNWSDVAVLTALRDKGCLSNNAGSC